ncbi:hypothetical protein GCM10020216_004350 [Nonomuraea helvata]
MPSVVAGLAVTVAARGMAPPPTRIRDPLYRERLRPEDRELDSRHDADVSNACQPSASDYLIKDHARPVSGADQLQGGFGWGPGLGGVGDEHLVGFVRDAERLVVQGQLPTSGWWKALRP